ncbi:hypothetical protein ZWY2020_015262 [Hordeum vulgare]|nr:hypothetical protein ZWY2020_015262 [Hordeum vulgare]
MAVRGEDGKLELAIHDYPYANDGLLIWDAIKQWAFDYVAHYYPCAADIVNDDVELQAWWNAVRTKAHADKKDEPWWLKLDCHESLVQTLSTIMWVASAHHAAVNFSQYPFGGYVPAKPSLHSPHKHAVGDGSRWDARVHGGARQGVVGHIAIPAPKRAGDGDTGPPVVALIGRGVLGHVPRSGVGTE